MRTRQSAFGRHAELSKACRLLSCLFFAWSCSTIISYRPQAAPSAFVPTRATAQTQSRRALLGAALSAGVIVPPAFAAEAPPQAIFLTGKRGFDSDRFNGKWTVVLGNQMNGKPVYKRNGESLYLAFNNCGQYQIDSKITGECGGIATNTKEGWKFGSEVDTKVKVRPIKPGEPEPTDEELSGSSKQEVRNAVNAEKAKMEREGMVDSFTGKLDVGEEELAGRLMAKFGVNQADVVGR
mmetsp:Transcript_15524/g.35516  ORF Transcript_15524/g.35516 Transcript_15524/m.35516 type:complete len:238 (-) Transcript_15524:123-836(-)